MNQVTRQRALLALLGVVVAILCLTPGGNVLVWAQTSPAMTPTFTPFAVPPTFTPFGTPFVPPGPVLTATPTRDLRVVNEITFPRSGDAVAGYVPIVGTALIDNYLKYDVHISPTGAEDWQGLQSSYKIVRNGILYALNTYQLPDGFYDVRVRAIQVDGNYSEAFLRRMEVRNANPPTPTPSVNSQGTPQPMSPLLVVATRPPITPTPIFQSYIPNGQGIYAPQNGDILRGNAQVVATTNSKTRFNPFQRFELYLSPAGQNRWDWLYASGEQHWQTPIYLFDTLKYPDGLYDLRLRNVYADGNYDEYYATRLRIDNGHAYGAGAQTAAGARQPGIYFPLAGAEVIGVMELVGTTAVPGLLRWELYWAPSGTGDWRFLVSDTRPVVNGLLARLDLALLPPGSYDFRLRIVRQDYQHSDYDVAGVQAVAATPTPLPVLQR